MSTKEETIATQMLEGIGIAPESQEIRGQQNLYEASQLGNMERIKQLIESRGVEFAMVPDEKGKN